MAETTKTEMAYRMIRNKITTGKCKPGTKLNISELAVMAGTSIIPIREAIKQLQIEGLVEIDSYKGAKVVSFSQREMREIYLIRSELEGLAGRLAAEQATPAQIARLEKILANPKMSSARINSEFHKAIYRMADSDRLFNIIMNVWDTAFMVSNGLALHNVEGQKLRSSEAHRKILLAITQHDCETTDKLIKSHILDTGERVIAWMVEDNLEEED